jgi:hypothetical protein
VSDQTGIRLQRFSRVELAGLEPATSWMSALGGDALAGFYSAGEIGRPLRAAIFLTEDEP